MLKFLSIYLVQIHERHIYPIRYFFITLIGQRSSDITPHNSFVQI